MIVTDLMNREPSTIAPEADLSQALQTMADSKLRHLVVLEGGKEVIGVLSDRDLALFYDPVNMTEARWKEVTVRQLMSAEPVTIGSGADVQEAARMLLRHAISALPVVDNGALVGIIGDRDFTRHFAAV